MVNFNIIGVSTAFLSYAYLVEGHAALIRATGSSGGTGAGFGVVANTPRNAGNARAQADSTNFRGSQNGCGSTSGGGRNDIQQGLAAAVAAGLPVVTSGGTLSMTMQIVNGDGAGPFNCKIDTTGTGQNFVPLQMAANSNNRQAPAPAQIAATMPAGLACTGTSGGTNNICIVRCDQGNGFGGCVAVQAAGGVGAGAGNGAGDGNNGQNGNNGNGQGNGQGSRNGNGNNRNANRRARASRRQRAAARAISGARR